MLMALIDKIDSIQKQMGNVSKEMEILRIKQNKNARDKNTITEIRNAFDGPVSTLEWMGKEYLSQRIYQYSSHRAENRD